MQRKLAQCKAPEVILTLLEEAREAGVSVQHVLFGSWFCSSASLHQIHELGYDVIAYVKITKYFLINYSFTALYNFYATSEVDEASLHKA